MADAENKKPSVSREGRRTARTIAPYWSHIRFRDPPCPGGQVGVGVGPLLMQSQPYGISVRLSMSVRGIYIRELATTA